MKWVNPENTLRVMTALTNIPTSRGTRAFVPPIQERRLSDLDDGIGYFHVTQEFADGTDRTMHYKLMIDSVPPSLLDVREESTREPKDPNVTFFVNATDTLSGIERVDFSVDGAAPDSWRDIASRKYSLAGVTFGDHTLRAVAYDRAGNSIEKTVEFSVEPLPPPTIVFEGTPYSEGDTVQASGTALAATTLRVYFSSDGIEPFVESVQVESDGTFEFESRLTLKPGTYLVSADIVDEDGATSERIAEEEISVGTTIRGTISRHPMTVAAGIAAVLSLITLFFGARWFLRKREEIAVEPFSEGHGVPSNEARRATSTSVVHMEANHEKPREEKKIHEKKEISSAGTDHRPIMDHGVVDLRPATR
jgi:hypothetical protein